jgi:hypothetical protein
MNTGVFDEGKGKFLSVDLHWGEEDRARLITQSIPYLLVINRA